MWGQRGHTVMTAAFVCCCTVVGVVEWLSGPFHLVIVCLFGLTCADGKPVKPTEDPQKDSYATTTPIRLSSSHLCLPCLFLGCVGSV